MAVDLPTTADVRKARHDAAKTAAQRAEAARTPLLAVLGAGELAVNAVSKAVAELPQHLNTDELRKAVAELREQAGHAYTGFAEHGEQTWGRIRKQPQVKDALQRIGTYTEKLDSRVDDIVDDARDATEKALTTVSTQTRSTGERIARVTQRFTGRTAETVTSVSEDVSTTVAQAGAETAEAVTEAGAEVAHETRSTTRRAANSTAPKTGSTTAARKPAARRNGSANGPKSTS
jgi:heparin binding hemagglutinin HbhA